MDELCRNGESLGLKLTPDRIAKFTLYLEEMRRWNKTYSLTAITDPAAIIRKHFLDSLNYVTALAKDGDILDFGSGPGLPGLPLAIVRPQNRFVLIDGRRKKTLFLEFMVRKLGLENVEINHLHLNRGNAREVFAQPFSHIVTRAVALLREVVPVADLLLKNRGTLVFSDARPDRNAIKSALENWPELKLEKLEKSLVPGRAPDIYLGSIRKM